VAHDNWAPAIASPRVDGFGEREKSAGVAHMARVMASVGPSMIRKLTAWNGHRDAAPTVHSQRARRARRGSSAPERQDTKPVS
jgi:hypothetical protein